ncbi:DUF120 domain-containing protein [Halobacteriaceae archaeon SHR40]|uniref:DUF120 domain-containing protein n=1 Tax=Halovenus amylolytica TaxID=2500550 RepID=UPI000FE37328
MPALGVQAAVLRPLVPGYPDRKTEVVAPVHLRSLFGLESGDSVTLTVDGTPWLPEGHSFVPASLDSFEAVVVDPSGLSLGLRDVLAELDAQVALWTLERSDAGAGGDSAGDRRHRYSRWYRLTGRPTANLVRLLGTTPGNGVFIGNSRADAEAASEIGVSVLRPNWL